MKYCIYIQDRFALEEKYFRCRSLTKNRAKETRKSCTKNSRIQNEIFSL